jgi:hypothetical protein
METPKVSLKPSMLDPSTSCGQATSETSSTPMVTPRRTPMYEGDCKRFCDKKGLVFAPHRHRRGKGMNYAPKSVQFETRFVP